MDSEKRIEVLKQQLTKLKTIDDYLSELELGQEIKNEYGFKKISKFNLKKKTEKVEKDFLKWKEKQIYIIKTKESIVKKKIKKLENISKWNSLSEEEKKSSNIDLSFYQANTIGYWFILLTVLLEIIYLILSLSVLEKSFWVGIIILFNIGCLLFLFTAAISIKNYKKKFSYYTIGFGIYNALRFVILPYIVKFNIYQITGSKKVWILGCIIAISIICILVGIFGIKKSNNQEQYIKDGKISIRQMSK